MSKRFLFTILTILIIALGTGIGITLAKGYRFSPKQGTLSGTGIISVTTVPDQASVYLDDHLTAASNDNINSLLPKSYNVKIVKDGYIPWEKKVEVKEGLVTEIKATLFRSIPTVYPLTYNGASNLVLSPDSQKLLFVIPYNASSSAEQNKKAGVWVWTMGERGINFAKSGEPHQIANQLSGLDFTKASFRWSPDSEQVLATFPSQSLLLDDNKINDPPRDITPILQATLNTWKNDQTSKDTLRLQAVKDLNLRKSASDSATTKWSLDGTKFFIPDEAGQQIKLYNITENKTYTLPFYKHISWLPDSNHLIVVEDQPTSAQTTGFPIGKISILEFDGSNKSEIFAGYFDPTSVYPWPDSSRLVILSSLPTQTASLPNLFGINLK